MKKILLFYSLVLMLARAEAQTPQRLGTERSKVQAGKEQTTVQSGRLQSASAYPAKAADPGIPFRITDPTIRAMNNRSAGSELPLYGSDGLLGLPKGTYGFARGQLWLRPTDATSIGGITGSGSVGTGGSANGVGTGGFANGVNGKSPYAGPTVWGSLQGMNLPDSVARRRPVVPRN